ncbi:Catalase/peroxidase HPI [Phytophthora cinnamomi]|uniref:Catalase/peroxidase HPI n=1 Tax=Phytophthora cinnamomi TaxID=4785 RepID=UPI0035597B2C|nr:Catalase/peroxidase HPI [Phytophthora cinnamomi]
MSGPSNATSLLAAEELAGERRCGQDHLRAGAREVVVPDTVDGQLAGQVALDDASKVTIDFMGTNNGNGTEILAPHEYYNTTLISVRDNIKTLGVSPYEAVALAGRSRRVAQQKTLGYSSSYSSDSLTLSNE